MSEPGRSPLCARDAFALATYSEIWNLSNNHCQHNAGMAHEAMPQYGRRLLPHILDSVALESPDRVVYSVLNHTGGVYKLQHVSASTFAKAVDKTAWWLQSLVGTHPSIRPLGYIGPRMSESYAVANPLQYADLVLKMIFDTLS